MSRCPDSLPARQRCRRLALGLILAGLVSLPSSAADPVRDLHRAARSGDLATVEALLAEGVAVDAADRWGTTALLLAAEGGHTNAVRQLLTAGADASKREGFFDTSPLQRALANGHDEIAILLLGAGAEERAEALAQAFERRDLDLARAAAKAGAIFASERQTLQQRFPDLPADLDDVLQSLRTTPDPRPPRYGADELAAFTGSFEGEDDDLSLVVRVEGEALRLELGERTSFRLAPLRENVFSDAQGGVEASFWGRAGLIEGLRLARPDAAPVALRRSVAEPVDRRAKSPSDAPRPEIATVNWPGFRGANATGIGDGRDAPVEWDLESGQGVVWQAAIPGLGNSSPVVWGDRVFVTTAVADDQSAGIRTGRTGSGAEVEEAEVHSWRVLAYDKATGDLAWSTEVGRAVPLTRRHFKATQANSSPATDGEHLVVVFPTAGLACLGLDGSLHWKHELGGLNAGGFNDPGLQWGFASSPLVWKDRAILQVDIHDETYVAAWDLATGEPLWRTERPGVMPSWSTPVVWPTPEGPQIVANASIIKGYDPASGRQLWSLGPSSVQVVATPVVGDRVVFVGAGYPPVKPIYAVLPSISGEVEAEPGSAHADLRWSSGRGGAYMPTPLLYRGLLYVVHHNGRLVAYDAATGDALYKERFSQGGTFTNSPIAVNGRIYTGTEEGQLYIFAAGPEYRELAVHDFDEPLMATPAVSEGILFVRTPSKLWALGSRHGSDPK